MLELFAPFFARAVGIDASPAMLAVARANLDRAGVSNAQVRLGDIYNLPLPRDSFDVVTIHQVLHYLDGPERALAEAARVLRPGGRLLVVDFAPHDLEFLREKHAHRRLGFNHDAVRQWVEAAGLALDRAVDLPAGDRDKLTVTLWLARDRRIAERLAPLSPAFVSVTYGAGGSTRERTHATVARILAETALQPAAHLTCVAATRGEVDDVVRAYQAAGVRHVVALRGDPVGGAGTRYEPHPGGYVNAADLVSGIRALGGHEI
jgi:SAM-dependent methyltransferase